VAIENKLFVNMAFVTPLPDKEKQMIENMHSFAEALEGQPGFIRAFVLAEDDGKTLLGVSMWSDDAAFRRGMENVRPPPPAVPTETLREHPAVMRHFVEV